MKPMTTPSQPASDGVPADQLLALANIDVQRRAAFLAQDAFAQVFRLSAGAEDEERARGVDTLRQALANWAAAGEGEDGRALRLAMLLSGLDQWGLAYSRAFGLQAIPALSELMGGLRTALDARDDARLQRQFAAIDAEEGNVIDFKIDLRRAIHLALWHAMIASESRDQAGAILTQLGGMMFVLVRDMPQLGWRLVADALAHIQIQCLAHGLAADGLGREMTTSLFGALAQELPADRRDLVMAHSGRAVMAWQQANRPAPGTPLH